jgi:predicted RNA-binding protein with PIN domain
MKQQELSVLSNVIAVARRELADRDDKEVPNKLKRVWKSAARTLPAPFRNSLIDEICTNEGFRESVLERWEHEGIDDPIGEAFLTDPQAGAHQVSEQSMSLELDKLAADMERANGTIRSLKNKLEESKRRLSEARAAHRNDLRQRDAAAKASRKSLERNIRTIQSAADGFDEERDQLSGRIETLESEMANLRAKLRRSRDRDNKRAKKRNMSVRQVATPPSDPVELAAWLDTVEKQQRSFRQARGADAEATSDHPPLRIPGGLLPDSDEALLALIEQRPDVIYVDGYNVGALLVEDFGTSKARTRVVAIADRLASTSGARIVVVFDAVGVEGRASAPSPGRAEVRFTHAQIADDEIVQLLQVNRSRAAVITSDRELSDRCAAEGCVTVWSEALVQWAGR